MNKSSEIYDHKLNEIEHYKRFPVMKPYIGKNYGRTNNSKIMLIAESHYFPPTSTINKDTDKWYDSTQKDLEKEEIRWINTREIVGGEWKPAGHMIHRELNLRMSEFMDTSKFRAMTNIVFMNRFQRPADETGDSIKHFCKPIDCQIGAQTIQAVIDIVEPNLIIFVSKFSWDVLRWKLPKKDNGMKIEYVCHPGTGGRYWHNKKYQHGLKKFKKLIGTELEKKRTNKVLW